MKKLELFIVKPCDKKDQIYKNLIKYLKKKGIKIKRDRNGK